MSEQGMVKVLNAQLVALTVSENADGFCRAALEHLREHISFDSALWGLRAPRGDADVFVGIAVDAEAMTASYNQLIGGKEPLAEHLLSGATGAYRGTKDDLELANTPLFEWLSKWGIQHAIGVGELNRRSGVYQSIALYRKPGEPKFDEHEAQILEAVTDNLCHGLRSVRERRLKEELFQSWADANSLATATLTGLMFDMEQTFLDGLVREWPHWQGPELPRELQTQFDQNDAPWTWRQGRTQIRCEPNAGNYLLIMTDLGELATLTPRQYEVAQLYAEGHSTKAIAQHLGTKVVTVENHRKNLYQALDIGSNNELTRAFANYNARLGGRPTSNG